MSKRKQRQYEARYRERHREELRERGRRWRKAHPEKVKEWSRRYRDANSEKLSKRSIERAAERYKTDPVYREARLARNREWQKANAAQQRERKRLAYQRMKAERPEALRAANAKRRGKRKIDPMWSRYSTLKAKYGISRSEYEAMFAAQGGRCAICGTTDPKQRGGFFAVDHDHSTGAVRGLLCKPCNTVLGFARDDVGVLLSAVEYLTQHAPQALKSVS